jgi:hypothetical protein
MQRGRLGQTEGEPEREQRGEDASGPGAAHGTNISVNAWPAHHFFGRRVVSDRRHGVSDPGAMATVVITGLACLPATGYQQPLPSEKRH